MKKIVFGSIMMLTGVIASALLMAGSMSPDWATNGPFTFVRNLSEYGLDYVLYVFYGMAIVGILIAISELMKK